MNTCLCAGPVLSQSLTFRKNLCVSTACARLARRLALSEPPSQASQADRKRETSREKQQHKVRQGHRFNTFFPQYLFNILFLGVQRGLLSPHLPTPWPLTSQPTRPQVRTKGIQMARRKKQAPRKTGIAGTSSRKEISRSTWEFV